MRVTRRELLASGAAIAGLGATGSLPALAAAGARYVRYDVASPEGQEMLKSYAVAVGKMLEKPASDPHNWFRNAFVHMMDCPHGNWWFYVWHRGYVGFVEQTVRELSGNPDFAFPYWDWTENPALPEAMFAGPLTPVADAFRPYTKDLATFTAFIQPTLKEYWARLNPLQKNQQTLRGNKTFDDLWNAVTGNDGTDISDQAFAITDRARYVTATKPQLPPDIAKECGAENVARGLKPTLFTADSQVDSFTSSRTASHNAMPGAAGTFFSILEGQPHNHVHNFIGGAFNSPDSWGDGPFGNMTNNLSPVDPIFFLHHSNMDRLWWAWEDKQRALKLPTLPTDPTVLAQFKNDPFLFFWRADGTPVLDGKAGDYIDPARFDYRYEKPVGQTLMMQVAALSTPAARARPTPRLLGRAGTAATARAPMALAASAPASDLLAVITFDRPVGPGAPREYAVLVNAPASVTSAAPDSPYYAGSVSFFGPPMRSMTQRSTFVVPLPGALTANAGGKLEIRLVPPANQPTAPAPAIQALEIHAG